MVIKKQKQATKVLTTKMPGETRRQYSAWLLYCETGSFDKLLETWGEVTQKLPKSYPEFESLVTDLGKPVSRQSIKVWSKKYRWIERTALQLEEELTKIKQKTDRFRKERKYLITDILIQKTNKIRRRASQQEATVLELKYLWEMHRTEFGESTGKTEVTHRIDEKEQTPLTPEEETIGKEIDEVIKKHYGRKSK